MFLATWELPCSNPCPGPGPHSYDMGIPPSLFKHVHLTTLPELLNLKHFGRPHPKTCWQAGGWLSAENLLVKHTLSVSFLITYSLFSLPADKLFLKNYYLPETNCEGKFIPEEFFPSGYGVAIPLGSPYKPFFDRAYVKL